MRTLVPSRRIAPSFRLGAAALSVLLSAGFGSEVASLSPERLAMASKSAAALRVESRALFQASKDRAPQAFAAIRAYQAKKISNLLQDPPLAIPMETVRGKPYGAYNMEVWNVRKYAEDSLVMAEFLSTRGPSEGKPEDWRILGRRLGEIADHFQSNGLTGSPDRNLDRFILHPMMETFLLCEDRLGPDLRNRLLTLFSVAAATQKATYGNPKENSLFLKYPNMDSLYMAIMALSGRLFGEAVYDAEVDKVLAALSRSLVGGTWDYIQEWNPDPRYTRVVLEGVGRVWQITGKTEAKRQIALHREYLVPFLEPSGVMDFGMSPFIKHDWQTTPYGAIGCGLDLVALVAPHPVLKGHLRRFRSLAGDAASVRFDSPFPLYWLASDAGAVDEAPKAFLAESAEIRGFRFRTSDRTGTLSAYLNANPIAADTRISALDSSSLEGRSVSALAGIYLQLFQEGANFHLSDMQTEVERTLSAGVAKASFVSGRHTLGKGVPPLPFGNHLATVKDWKYNCWKGGSPGGPPVRTKETYEIREATGFVKGRYEATATNEVFLDRCVLQPFWFGGPDESSVEGSTLWFRIGGTCLGLRATEGPWEPVRDGVDWHFRVDVPKGNYEVTLVAGDSENPTEAFGVRANGRDVRVRIAAERGKSGQARFPVTVEGDGIVLSFVPVRTGEHWKLTSLRIEGPTVQRRFAVGPTNRKVAAGEELLSGSMVYSPEAGFGWSRNMKGWERDRRRAGSEVSTLITCPDVVRPAAFLASPSNRTWASGTKWAASMVLGRGATIDAFRKSLAGEGEWK